MLSLFSKKLSIYVCSYDRGSYTTGEKKPEHWAIKLTPSATSSADQVHTFEVIHSHPQFEYRHSTHKPLREENLTHALKIGRISERKLVWVREVCERVHVDNTDKEWNCHDWVKAAVKGLEGEGDVKEGISECLDEMLR